MPLQAVAYAVYEAKRCSEKCGSVGEQTALVVLSPYSQETMYAGCLKIMRPSMVEALGECWENIWKLPLERLPDLPSGWFLSEEELAANRTGARPSAQRDPE
jgi:hypothetical protein